jgi:hypothetical protein
MDKSSNRVATFRIFVAAGVVSGLPITPILLSSLVNFVSASFASGAKEASLVVPNIDGIKLKLSNQLLLVYSRRYPKYLSRLTLLLIPSLV